MRLRLRLLPSCAAGYNTVFVSSKRRALPEHAVQKNLIKKMASRAVGNLTKCPPLHSSTAWWNFRIYDYIFANFDYFFKY